MASAKKTTRKTTPLKRVGRKPQARKSLDTGAAKLSKLRATLTGKLSLGTVAESAKDVAHAQLGLYGKVYDELNGRYSKMREQAPRQWNELIKRGEQVRGDLEKAQKDLTKDLKARVKSLDVKAGIEERIEQVRSTVAKIKDRVLKAA